MGDHATRRVRFLRWDQNQIYAMPVPPPPDNPLCKEIEKAATKALTNFFKDNVPEPFKHELLRENRLLPEMYYLYFQAWEQREKFSLDDWLLVLLAQDHPLLDYVFFARPFTQNVQKSALQIRWAGVDKFQLAFLSNEGMIVEADDPFRLYVSAFTSGLSVGFMRAFSELVLNQIVRPLLERAQSCVNPNSPHRDVIIQIVFVTAVYWVFKRDAQCSYKGEAYHGLIGLLSGNVNCQLSYLIVAYARVLNLKDVHLGESDTHVTVQVKTIKENGSMSMWCVLETTRHTKQPWVFISESLAETCQKCICNMFPHDETCNNQPWWNDGRYSLFTDTETYMEMVKMVQLHGSQENRIPKEERNVNVGILRQRLTSVLKAWYRSSWDETKYDDDNALDLTVFEKNIQLYRDKQAVLDWEESTEFGMDVE